jgi:multidrug efflux pump subunit AcrA (membrane-fusion protein)
MSRLEVIDPQIKGPVRVYAGCARAIQSVTLMAREAAFVEKIDFQEGGLLEVGQTLFKLQKVPYQAVPDGVQAAPEKAQATESNALIARTFAKKRSINGRRSSCG